MSAFEEPVLATLEGDEIVLRIPVRRCMRAVLKQEIYKPDVFFVVIDGPDSEGSTIYVKPKYAKHIMRKLNGDVLE